MALASVQILASARSSGTSLARTFASNVTAGSLLIAHGSVFNSGGSGEPTVSDNINGTWSSQSTTGYFTSGDADSEIYLWSFPNSGAGTITVTMNPPGTSSDNDLTLFEVSGAATSSPRDKSVTNTGAVTEGVGYTSDVTTGTLAQAAEFVVFSHSHTDGTLTLGTDTGDSFTQADENQNNASGQAFNVGYKITSVTTSLVCNGTGSGSPSSGQTWFTGVASYKEAGAAAASIPPVSGFHRALIGM